jgi:hypothetical protein
MNFESPNPQREDPVQSDVETTTSNSFANRVRRAIKLTALGSALLSGVEGTAQAQDKTAVLEKPAATRTIESDPKQEMWQKLQEIYLDMGVKIPGIDTLHVMYMGDSAEKFRNIPDIDKKLASAAQGVHDVERIFGLNLADTLGVVDSLIDNAYVYDSRKKILFFYTMRLTEYDTVNVHKVARHEAIHLLDHIRGYSNADSLDEAVFEFEHMKVKKRGQELTNRFTERISEDYFFNIANAGHPSDNKREFLASFINSLINIEDLPKILSKTASGYAGSNGGYLEMVKGGFILSPLGRKELVKRYIHTTEMLLRHAEKNEYKTDADFFKSRLEYLKGLST